MSDLREKTEAVLPVWCAACGTKLNTWLEIRDHWNNFPAHYAEVLISEPKRAEAKVEVPFDPYDKSDKEKAAQIYYGLSRAEQSAAPAPESEAELREKLKELFAGEPFYEMSTDEVIDQILALWRTKVLRTRFTGCACRSDMGHGQAPSRVGERR